MKCTLCEDCGWVCESRPDRPWEGEHACSCGAVSALQRDRRRYGTADAERLQNRIRQEGLALSNRGWQRRFDDPIPLPRSRQLVTLEDAGQYITKLPKADHTTEEWQAAMGALILVATSA